MTYIFLYDSTLKSVDSYAELDLVEDSYPTIATILQENPFQKG